MGKDAPSKLKQFNVWDIFSAKNYRNTKALSARLNAYNCYVFKGKCLDQLLTKPDGMATIHNIMYIQA